MEKRLPGVADIVVAGPRRMRSRAFETSIAVRGRQSSAMEDSSRRRETAV
jgi:hypothetical protein